MRKKGAKGIQTRFGCDVANPLRQLGSGVQGESWATALRKILIRRGRNEGGGEQKWKKVLQVKRRNLRRNTKNKNGE